jgi:hypothetical protein
MSRRLIFVLFIVSIILVSGAVVVSASQQGQSLVLFDFNRAFDTGSVITSDAKLTLSKKRSLQIETGHKNQWPGITLKAPAGKWDLSKYEYISIDVKNLGSKPITVSCRVDNPDSDGRRNCVTDNITLKPKAAGKLVVRLFPTPWRLSEPVELIGMRGAPVHSGKIDPANITQLLVYVSKSDIDHKFDIKNISAGGRIETLDVKTFFPFIDEFGQYIHKDCTEAGLPGQSLKLPAFSAPKNIRVNGGWWIRGADYSSHTVSTASAAQMQHRLPTVNIIIATCLRLNLLLQGFMAAEAGRLTDITKTIYRIRLMISAGQTSCENTGRIGKTSLPK